METPKTTYDLTDQLQDFEQYICPVSTQTLPVLYSHVLIPLYSCHMFIVLQWTNILPSFFPNQNFYLCLSDCVQLRTDLI